MRIPRGLLAILTASVMFFPAGVQAESLSDAVGDALKKHPFIKAKTAARQSAHESVREERSNYLPNISLSTDLGPSYDENDTTRGLGEDHVTSLMFNGRAALRQMVYDNKETKSRVIAAELREKAAEGDLEFTQEQLAMDAVDAYLEVLRTRELLKLSMHYRETLAYYLEKIRMRAMAGAGDEVEVAEAEERMAFAESNVLRFQRDMNNAENRFREVVGRAPDKKLDPVIIPAGAVPETVDDAVKVGLESNPQLMAANLQARGRQHDMMAEKARLLPRLDAELSYNQKELAENAGGQAINAQALVKLSWEITTGGGKSARVDRASYMRHEAEAQRLGIMREVERKIRDAYVDMNILRKDLEILRERELKNRAILKSYNEQYDAGKRTFLQIVGIETRVFNSQADSINGLFKLVQAKAELLATMGRLRQTLKVGVDNAQGQQAGVTLPFIKEPAVSKKEPTVVPKKKPFWKRLFKKDNG